LSALLALAATKALTTLLSFFGVPLRKSLRMFSSESTSLNWRERLSMACRSAAIGAASGCHIPPPVEFHSQLPRSNERTIIHGDGEKLGYKPCEHEEVQFAPSRPLLCCATTAAATTDNRFVLDRPFQLPCNPHLHLMMRPSRTARFLPRLNGMVDADRVRKRREPKLRRESKRSTCKIVLHTARAWELKQAGKQDKSSCPESNLVTRHMTVLLTCDLKRNIHLPTNVSFGDTCT
jgi:hypothetical protein